MEHKSFPTEFKIDEGKGEFEGYASVFGFRDSGGDVVEKGAFTKTLQESAKRVRVLWQHNPYEPIGKPLDMLEDSKGLLTRSRIAPTTLGTDTLILMKEGVIQELSIGYDSIKETFDSASKTRHLIELKLWEYSPVTWAMNEMATITGVKSAEDLEALLLKITKIESVGLKAGRVLSAQNMARLKEAITVLQEIYASAQPEPDKSSTRADGKTEAEPGNHSVTDLLAEIKGLGQIGQGQKLLESLRRFGAELRGEA